MMNKINIQLKFLVTFLHFYHILGLYMMTSNLMTRFASNPNRRITMISPNSLDLSSYTFSPSSLNLAITASSKTTATDDPTAGMSPEQITDYISNVGGGMCGLSEGIGGFIGLGLNLSLLAFGIFTIGYVVLGGLNFKFEKDTEDLVKKYTEGNFAATSASAVGNIGYQGPNTVAKAGEIMDNASGTSKLNRSERRMRKRLSGDEEGRN